jgi:hypothetical protein
VASPFLRFPRFVLKLKAPGGRHAGNRKNPRPRRRVPFSDPLSSLLTDRACMCTGEQHSEGAGSTVEAGPPSLLGGEWAYGRANHIKSTSAINLWASRRIQRTSRAGDSGAECLMEPSWARSRCGEAADALDFSIRVLLLKPASQARL